MNVIVGIPALKITKLLVSPATQQFMALKAFSVVHNLNLEVLTISDLCNPGVKSLWPLWLNEFDF